MDRLCFALSLQFLQPCLALLLDFGRGRSRPFHPWMHLYFREREPLLGVVGEHGLHQHFELLAWLLGVFRVQLPEALDLVGSYELEETVSTHCLLEGRVF